MSWSTDLATLMAVLPELRSLPGDRDHVLFEQTLGGHGASGRLHLLQLRIDGELAAFAASVRTGPILRVYADGTGSRWLGHSADLLAATEVLQYAWADPEVHTLELSGGGHRDRLGGRATLALSHEVTLASGPVVARLAAVHRRVHR